MPHALFGQSIVVDRGGCPDEYAPFESDVSPAAFVPVGSRETSSCVQIQAPRLEMIVAAAAIQASFSEGQQTSQESELPRVQIETLELMEAKVHFAASVWCVLVCIAL